MTATSLNFPALHTKEPFSLTSYYPPRLNTERSDTVSLLKANHLFVDRLLEDIITLYPDRVSHALTLTKPLIFCLDILLLLIWVLRCLSYCSLYDLIYDAVKQTKSSERQNSVF